VNNPDQLVALLSGQSLAEGGDNISLINNPEYDAAVEAAMAKTGVDACVAFQQAEAILFKASDFLAWAERPNQIFVSKVTYQYIGRTQVTALRMLTG
jgi:peptide/nickel transport system substrate-binding protein